MKLSQNSEELFAKIGAGDIAIDCGAHVGHVTMKMAEKGATVYAFEPNPYSFEYLQNRFKDNPNIICINKGVWDKNTRIPLFFAKEHSNENPLLLSYASSIFNNYLTNPSNYIQVEVIDLIHFIRVLNRKVKLLKIDIEGAEYDILNKIIKTNLYTMIDKIVVETHEWLFPELKSKDEELRNLIKQRNITNIDLNWV